jgi:hypothetical protein
VKSAEQQALLAMHRVRQGFVVERTATINRLRGLLAEFGVVLALRSVTVRRQAAAAAEKLPELARRAIGDLLEQLRVLDERIGGYDREIEAQARLSRSIRNSPLRTIEISPPLDDGGGRWRRHLKLKWPVSPPCRAAMPAHRLVSPCPGWAWRSRWLAKNVGKKFGA